MEDFQRALEIDANDSDLYYHRGQVCTRAGVHSNGTRTGHHWTWLTRRHRAAGRARRCRRDQVNFLNGKLDEAIADYEKSMEINGEIPFGARACAGRRPRRRSRRDSM